MPHTKSTQTFKTDIQGLIRIPCQKCTGKTDHAVLAALDVRSEYSDNGFTIDFSEENQLTQCQGCKSVTFRRLKSNSEDFFVDHEGETIYDESETLFPARAEGREGINEGVWFLPISIRNLYEETFQAIASNHPILAGIGLRALVEAICKDQKAIGKDLYLKITDLTAKGVLTPGGAAILHKIRALGNAAAHETKPHAAKQLALAMDVVEHLLEAVYILPARAKAEFENEE